MKKKVFSKLLMGALLVASVSSFTSCKDYDDDINDLRSRIDGLNTSLNTTVTNKIATVESSIDLLSKQLAEVKADYAKADEALKTALQTSISAATDKASAAADKATANASDIVKLQGEVVNLKTAEANLQAAIDKLEGALKEANLTLKSQGETLIGLAATDQRLETGINEAKAQAANALSEAQKAQTAAATNATNLAKTDATVAALQTTVSDNLTSVNNRISSEIAKLDARIKTNEGNIAKLQEAATKAEANFTTINTKLTELAAKDTEISNTVSEGLTKLAASLGTSVEELKTLINNNKSELISKIGEEATARVEAINALSNRVTANEVAISNIQSETIPQLIKNLREHLVPEYVEKEVAKQLPAALEVFMNDEVMPYVEDIVATETGKNKSLIDALAAKVKQDSTDLAAFTDAQFLLTAGLLAGKYELDDEASADALSAKALADAIAEADGVLQGNIDIVAGALADEKNADKAGSLAALIAQIKNEADETSIAAKLKALTNGFNATVDETNPASLAGRFKTIEDFFAPAADETEAADISVANLAAKIAETESFTTAVAKAASDANGEVLGMITAIHLFANQHMANCDEQGKIRKWNGEAEKYEYTYGYDNFDHYLTFVYTVEQGIDYDYCDLEAKTPNWNYPEGLIRQLKGITAKKDDKVPADYDFSYDKGGFTGTETDYDFVDGRFRTFSDSILVRVSPTNADLRKAEIALLNSKGQNIVDAGLVTIEGVKKYDGMITREPLTRAAEGNETGLWVIKFNLAYDKIDSLFSQYATYKGGDIVYAVAVKNAGVTLDEEGEVDTDAQRYVVSEYDLSLDLEQSYNAWNFTVNGTTINKIHNRYIMPEQSANGYTAWTDDPKHFTGSFRYELTWSGEAPCCDEQEGDDDDDDDDDDEVEEIKSTWYEYCYNCYFDDDDDYDCENEDLWSRNIFGGFNTILFKEEFDNTNTDVAEDECRGVNTVDRLNHMRSDFSQARYTSGVDNRHQYEPLGIEFSADQAPEGESGEWAEIDIKFPVSICGYQTRIRGFFVTLDNHFAIESDNSEINAWATYKFKNVAKYNYNHAVKETDPEELIDEAIVLQPGNEGKIWIKDAKNLRNGDVIGFRVHAVNLDGTFTDPDGRAFYVRIGKEEKNRKMSFHVTTTKNYETAWALQDAEAAANNQIIADFNKKQADEKSDDRFFNRDPYSSDQYDAQNYSVVYYWRGENPAIRASQNVSTTEAWYPVANTGRYYYNEKFGGSGARYTRNDDDEVYSGGVSPEDIFSFMYNSDADAAIDATSEYDNPNNENMYWSNFSYSGNGQPNKLTLSVKAAIKQYWANRLEDNKTYHLTMEIRRTDGMTNSYRVINTYDIDITKVMPTGLPEDFSVKSNQLAGGAWTIYLRPWVEDGVVNPQATTMPVIDPNPWINTWYDKADKWIAGATDKKAAFANGFNSIDKNGKVIDTDGQADEHPYRWGMDVRPYNLEGMFNGLYVDDDNDGQPEISTNYFFVFTGSGSLATSWTNEDDFLNKDADAIATYNTDYDPYAVNPGNNNSALTHVEGAYRVPAIHWSHIGESKAVKAGYVYRSISGKVDPVSKKFIYPADEQEGYESLKTEILNWDWVIDPVAIMVGDKPLMATYACAMGAGVKFVDVAINPETKKAYEFEYNQDVTVNPFQGKFYYTSTKWFNAGGDKSKEQAYFDTQFEGAFGAAMKLEKADSASLEDVLANNVMWIDRTSLKFTTTTDGYNYTHYYFKPVWVDAQGNELKESDMAYDWYSYKYDFIEKVKGIAMNRMARDTGLPDFKTDVAGQFSFDIYDVWFHKTTVKVGFTIKKPENTTARATR